jgi:hypothetical protein
METAQSENLKAELFIKVIGYSIISVTRVIFFMKSEYKISLSEGRSWRCDTP